MSLGGRSRGVWLKIVALAILLHGTCAPVLASPPAAVPAGQEAVIYRLPDAAVLAGIPVNADRPPRASGKADPAVKESLFSKDYFKLLYDDTAYVLTSPMRWEKKEWTIFGLAVSGVVASALLDKPVWDFMQRNQTKTLNNITDIASDVGGIYSVALFVPFYVVGQATDNAKAVNVALDGWAASLIAAGMISPALKFIAGRSAPKEDEGTFTFKPFTYGFQLSGGAQSFPSGHAAEGFAIATVLAGHYEETWVRVAAYSLASLTSISRLYQGVHFVSDFAAGALIGTFVGYTVVKYNEKRRKEKKEQNIFLTPFIGPGAGGLSLTVRFDGLS